MPLDLETREQLLETVRRFVRETTLDLRVGRIEARIKAAWEQVKDFEAKWQEYTQTRQLPKLSRASGLAG